MISVRQHLDFFMENIDRKVSHSTNFRPFLTSFCPFFFQTTGNLIEPNKRYAENVRGREGRRIIKAHTICNQCLSSIVRQKGKMAEPLVIFQCAHQYHSSCLTEKQKELNTKKCPICLKHSYMAVREEREKLEQRHNN